MPSISSEDERLVRIGQAAEIAGVSIDTLRRWDADGHIEAIRTFGGQRRFRLGDIKALVASGPARTEAAS